MYLVPWSLGITGLADAGVKETAGTCFKTACCSTGPVAQWITRLTTDQKILGSTPGWLAAWLFFL